MSLAGGTSIGIINQLPTLEVQTVTIWSHPYAGGTNSCFRKPSLCWRHKQLLSKGILATLELQTVAFWINPYTGGTTLRWWYTRRWAYSLKLQLSGQTSNFVQYGSKMWAEVGLCRRWLEICTMPINIALYCRTFYLLLTSSSNIVAEWPVFHRPGRYFTPNLAEAGKRLVFWKSVPEADILKINKFLQLQKELTQISQIILTLVVNLVRIVLSAKFICCCWRNPWCDYHVTHTPKWDEPAKIRAIVA